MSDSEADNQSLKLDYESADEACLCSEDEEEHESPCFLCMNGDDRHGPIAELNRMHSQLVQSVSSRSVYKILHEHYHKNVYLALKGQGMKATEISEEEMREHYKSHRVDINQMLIDDISFINIMQKKLRHNGIFVENERKRKRVNAANSKLWTQLCRQKLDTIKYLSSREKK